MDNNKNGAVWLASYPKSGNTWLRCLLEAYRRNGQIDLNDMRISHSDGGATLMRGVSPMPLDALGLNGQMLLRPAALLNLFCRLSEPIWVKTHFANIQPDGLPPLIPAEFTKKAVYVVRDPRSVVLSMSRFFQFSIDASVETMRSNDFTIGDGKDFASCLVSSWTNHVAGWTSETRYPVHIVKYEDLMIDAGKELTEVLAFLEQDIDEKIVKKAVKATNMAKLQQKEESGGFRENSGKGGGFFNGGGTRWQDELGPKWIKQIEEDHGTVMRALGYLDAEVTELKAVE